MADLLTHYVSARVVGVGLRDRATAALFALGVFLPDLIGKPIGHLPGVPDLAAAPSHSLFGLVFACGAICFLFAPVLRARAFVALYAGSVLHVFADLMKDYLGRGSVCLLHPFSTRAWEVGLYRSEDVFILLPGNLAILGLFWLVGRRKNTKTIV
jgi:membrane-bound metal-dependent hydrolase YbcI (DUF457 family)